MKDELRAPAVTQADRARAARLEPDGRERDQILRGKRDKTPPLRAFARHREATRDEIQRYILATEFQHASHVSEKTRNDMDTARKLIAMSVGLFTGPAKDGATLRAIAETAE